jgi:hypothetical protein
MIEDQSQAVRYPRLQVAHFAHQLSGNMLVPENRGFLRRQAQGEEKREKDEAGERLQVHMVELRKKGSPILFLNPFGAARKPS